MATFTEVTDELGKVVKIKTNLKGKALLSIPKLNKGCAFTQEERLQFDIIGKLPEHVETIEEQEKRRYERYLEQPTALAKNIYLNDLKQNNETLFYRLAMNHIEEMLPVVYTPTIGDAVESFSYDFNLTQGLYFSYPSRQHFDQILQHRAYQDIDLVIVTDGEGVLGIGDWGIGGMDICIGKLMVYTLCGGINPRRVLPIMLDAGTNNEALLNDPMYLGWRHKRITGQDYDDFIDQAVTAIRKAIPNVYLHWEDFGRDNARKNLNRYREQMCTFNDDMQGTGATALACVLSGINAIQQDIKEQRIVFFGAGTAGVGIADQICSTMVQAGLSPEEARKHFWLIDRPGLLVDDMEQLAPFQQPYARSRAEVAQWNVAHANTISLLDVVNNVQPTILIGCSTVTGAFTQEVVQAMAAAVERPMIFPLSNPTSKSEAQPKDLVAWTQGKALIATGSPFDPIEYQNHSMRISQCNNAYVFPGLGLGIIAAKATRVTDGMIAAASHALAEHSPAIKDPAAPLLPELNSIHEVSRHIALAVANQARAEQVAGIDSHINLSEKIDAIFWRPNYLPYELE